MKIGVYILNKNAKQTYKKECYNVRTNAGMEVVRDILRRAGYETEYCSSATAHLFDVILFSVTSDCDFWPFIAERLRWQKGDYKVILGGAGVLNVRPFLPWVDYFVLGRAENVIDKLIEGLANDGEYEGPSVIRSKTFDPNKEYTINQVRERYPHAIKLPDGSTYEEDIIGCNHKCFFCGYSWQRRPVLTGAFKYSGLWHGTIDRERAILDMDAGDPVDLNKLRTTAIDGLSERLRAIVNKKITNEMLIRFIQNLASCEKPHQLKLYNIVGYPTETEADWWEFRHVLEAADKPLERREKQTCILLHSTPFRAMPATPMCCAPMSYKNYRRAIADALGKGMKGNIFFQGNSIWAVESMATESLPTVIQSAIVWRGTERDSYNFAKLAASKKFQRADAKTKQATLEKYFDVATLFGAYDMETVPTRYLKTYVDYKKIARQHFPQEGGGQHGS